jgi:hypothetical protein
MTFTLGDSQIVGRLNKNAIPLDDVGASREHARIYKKGDQFTILDLNSKNGVLLNGQLVERALLTDGDELRIGETWMRVSLDEPDVVEERALKSAPRVPRTAGEAPTVQVRGKGAGGVSDKLIAVSRAAETRTSLAWLRTDLGQTSGLYRVLVWLGMLLVFGGLSYLIVAATT